MEKIKIIFVCLGNYCRSPMAEAIFNNIVETTDTSDRFEVSSAGTKDWDVGLQPDFRARQILAKADITLDPSKRAQRITNQELLDADYVIAMTKRIAQEIGDHDNIFLLMDFVEDAPSRDIPDPYPTDTFPKAFRLINQGVEAFYTYLEDNNFDK